MSAPEELRDEVAVELGIAHDDMGRGVPRSVIDRALSEDPALRVAYIARWGHLADALLASPALARVIQEKQGDAWHQGWVAGCVDAFSDGPTTANPYWPPAGGPDQVDTKETR